MGDTKQKFDFTIKDSSIIIGRGKKSSVKIEASILSKQHCTINYNTDYKTWEIKDGFANKPSLNGTWLLLNSKYKLVEDSFIKIGNNVINITME